MKWRWAVVAGIVLCSALILTSTSWSQSSSSGTSSSSSTSNSSNQEPVDITNGRTKFIGTPSGGVVEIRKGEPFVPRGSGRHIEGLVNRLREADDKSKVELTKELETAVAASFDADMKERENDLAKLEGRLNKLREQLDRRRKAKSEIIQLEVKVLTNEAAGLGFSGIPLKSKRTFGKDSTLR